MGLGQEKAALRMMGTNGTVMVLSTSDFDKLVFLMFDWHCQLGMYDFAVICNASICCGSRMFAKLGLGSRE